MYKTAQVARFICIAAESQKLWKIFLVGIHCEAECSL